MEATPAVHTVLGCGFASDSPFYDPLYCMCGETSCSGLERVELDTSVSSSSNSKAIEKAVEISEVSKPIDVKIRADSEVSALIAAKETDSLQRKPRGEHFCSPGR